MTATVGFIGLGNMGWPMAARLAYASYRTIVFDVDRARSDGFAREHAAISAATPAEAANAEFVITMLPSSAIVERVLTADDGILSAIMPRSILIEMSSGDPVRTQGFADGLEARGAAIIDAPVSGGVPRAVTGELSIMAGGADDAIDRALPLLHAMGSQVMRTGPLGSGHAMKALNNLVSAGGFLIGVEAMLIGQRFGLDPAVVVDVLNASTGVNNSTQKKFKQFVLSRRFDAGFGLDLMVKDIGIAASLAEATETRAPFTDLCKRLWSEAAEALGTGRDHTAMAQYSEQLAGTDLKIKAPS